LRRRVRVEEPLADRVADIHDRTADQVAEILLRVTRRLKEVASVTHAVPLDGRSCHPCTKPVESTRHELHFLTHYSVDGEHDRDVANRSQCGVAIAESVLCVHDIRFESA